MRIVALSATPPASLPTMPPIRHPAQAPFDPDEEAARRLLPVIRALLAEPELTFTNPAVERAVTRMATIFLDAAQTSARHALRLLGHRVVNKAAGDDPAEDPDSLDIPPLPNDIDTFVSTAFNYLNPEAVAWAESRAAELVVELSAERRAALNALIIRAFREGIPPMKLSRIIRPMIGLHSRWALAVDNYHRRLLDQGHNPLNAQMAAETYAQRLVRSRAQTIARTESLRASNQGRYSSWQMARTLGYISADAKKKWSISPNRVCPRCLPLRNRMVGLDEDFVPGTLMPPLHPRCLPGTALVDFTGLQGAYRRWHEGPMVEVRVAAGQILTVTPNHPVLTWRGWVASGELQEGDDLVHCALANDRIDRAIHPKVERVPSQISEVFDACTNAGLKQRVGGMSGHFHGDGFDSEVEIVDVDRMLANRLEPSGAQKLEQQILAAADIGHRLACSQSRPDMAGMGMSSSRERGAVFGSHPVHPNVHRLTAVARLDPGLQETTSYDVSRDPQRVGQRLLGDALDVVSNKIVEVRTYPWSGHVFNLQTESGWFNSGCFTLGNCRCTALLIP